MRDHQIRAALKNKVLARYMGDSTTLILDELALRHGAARVDVAVVNGIVHGFELKSDKDTLKRLPHQAKIYNSVLDRVTLVVGRRYIGEAMRIVPDWWGIKLVEMGPRGAIHFSDARRPRNNPSQDILSLSKLLWRDEALTLLDELGAAEGMRYKPRAMIYARLAEVADLDLVRCRVRVRLKSRANWRSDGRQKSDGD